MNRGQAPPSTEETKIIIVCEHCSQKLRLPRRNRKLRVTCPTCRHEFDLGVFQMSWTLAKMREKMEARENSGRITVIKPKTTGGLSCLSKLYTFPPNW